VLNGQRLVVVATLGWRNGPLLSTRSDDDDDDDLTSLFLDITLGRLSQ